MLLVCRCAGALVAKFFSKAITGESLGHIGALRPGNVDETRDNGADADGGEELEQRALAGHLVLVRRPHVKRIILFLDGLAKVAPVLRVPVVGAEVAPLHDFTREGRVIAELRVDLRARRDSAARIVTLHACRRGGDSAHARAAHGLDTLECSEHRGE